METDNIKNKCSFCGRGEDDVGPLISGPNGIFICSKCVTSAGAIYLKLESDGLIPPEFSGLKKLLTDNGKPQNSYKKKQVYKARKINLLPPKQLKEKLDEYVIGQDEAKKVLSVAVYNHYKRINYLEQQKELLSQKENNPELDIDIDSVDLEKTNILMVGPSGTGKTLMARTLADILNVPFAIADATTLTQAGYVGEDVENILLKLIKAADYDIKRAEKGIVFIDEIDKIAKKSENVSITRDVSGEGVQQALLKIIEGTIASVPPQGGRKHPQQEMYEINTKDILFICGGAFVGLDKIIEKRTDINSIGFNANAGRKNEETFDELLGDIHPEDLIKFGLIPEFVGRVPVAVALRQLDETALIRILTEPKNAICKQYKCMFKMDGIDISFENEALSLIAEKAIALKTGARGLRSILEDIMTDVMYDAPSNKNIESIIITKECIANNAEPTLIYKI